MADTWKCSCGATNIVDKCYKCGGSKVNYFQGKWTKIDNMINSVTPVIIAEVDPAGLNPNSPGAKLDTGKIPIRRGLLEYFPRACLAVAEVSMKGAEKYCWKGWETVENGIDRYGDAEVRHIVAAAIEGPLDPQLEVLHAAEEAWNALARLELILRENKTNE